MRPESYQTEGMAYLSTHVRPHVKKAVIEAAHERRENVSEFLRLAVTERLERLKYKPVDS